MGSGKTVAASLRQAEAKGDLMIEVVRLGIEKRDAPPPSMATHMDSSTHNHKNSLVHEHKNSLVFDINIKNRQCDV